MLPTHKLLQLLALPLNPWRALLWFIALSAVLAGLGLAWAWWALPTPPLGDAGYHWWGVLRSTLSAMLRVL